MQKEEMPNELPTDSSWEDTYDVSTYTSSGSSYDDEDRDYDVKSVEDESLNDYLLWQMRLTPFSETDAGIAAAIIDSISEDGYLSVTVDDIWAQLKDELSIERDEVEAVLHRVQNFDPPGVGARDLRESLVLQLAQIDPTVPWHKEAMELLHDHFQLLANRDYTQLQRKLKLSDEQLREVVKLIHSLNPRPGSQVAKTNAEYIVPDVYVRKINGKWRVQLNSDAIPKLSINSLYASFIQRADKSADNTYMQGQLQEARWLIKSLNSRNETLLKVAKCIVDRQRDFLEFGEEAMKALVLHDVAEEVGMHESTISRITNKKYMHTPRGIFELKYFFSSHVSTSSGGECSSTAIRALIKKLVSGEDARKPLSDSKIAKILSEQGINVARRTVAKYRDALSIPPSNERKRIA
jgi:RNA polymerase sigma-54 factor